jgi:tripeptidyl-peptidase-2
VPFGASWAEVTMRTSAFDTPRRFFLDTVQVSYIKFYLSSYF